MKVYICTSDSSNHVLPIFAYLFNKYWSKEQEVVCLGFKHPDFELPENFSFHSMAERQEGGINEWSTYLHKFFSSIPDEHFIFTCDDHLIVRPVDKKLFEKILTVCKEDDKVGRFDLTPTIQLAKERRGQTTNYKDEKSQILKLNQHSVHNFIYKITGQWSVWRRDYFLKNCPMHWSPWQWEVIGGNRAEGDGFEILGAKDHWCVKKVEGLSGTQWPGILNVSALHKEDVHYILDNNLSPDHRLEYYRSEWEELDDLVFGGYERIDLGEQR